MNSPEVEDLIIMLIAAGWSNRDILDVLGKVSSTPPSHLQRGLDELSWRFSDVARFKVFTRDYSYFDTKSQMSARRSLSMDEESELYQKVRDMLVVEIGLSSEQIVDLMSARLYKGGYVPPLSKKSLANWLERLSHYHSPSQILHAAAVVRDQYIKSSGLDWRIRGES